MAIAASLRLTATRWSSRCSAYRSLHWMQGPASNPSTSIHSCCGGAAVSRWMRWSYWPALRAGDEIGRFKLRAGISVCALGYVEFHAHLRECDADRFGVEHLHAGRHAELGRVHHIGNERA